MKNWLLIFLMIAAGSMLAFRTHDRKTRVIIIPTEQVDGKLDSIDHLILPYIGMSLTVDQANSVKKLYSDMMVRLIQAGRIDSIATK